METIKIALDIRKRDIDGNLIDTDTIKDEILDYLSSIWNIAGITMKVKKRRSK